MQEGERDDKSHISLINATVPYSKRCEWNHLVLRGVGGTWEAHLGEQRPSGGGGVSGRQEGEQKKSSRGGKREEQGENSPQFQKTAKFWVLQKNIEIFGSVWLSGWGVGGGGVVFGPLGGVVPPCPPPTYDFHCIHPSLNSAICFYIGLRGRLGQVLRVCKCWNGCWRRKGEVLGHERRTARHLQERRRGQGGARSSG